MKNYEKVIDYLNNNPNESYELGFQKDENNKIDIPTKRTYNHNIKTKLNPNQKQHLNFIAERILFIASEKGILLDLEQVKKVLREKKHDYESETKEAIKLVKKLVYPLIDLKIKKNGKFTTKDLLDVLVHVAYSNDFTNDGSFTFRDLNPDREDSPSGDLMMYHFSKLKSKNEIKNVFVKILDLVFKYVRKNYNLLNNRKFNIAYDIHKICYYGKNLEYVCGSEPKDGTSNFFEFLTCSIVLAGHRFILDVIPIHPINSLHKLLDESLMRVRNKIKIDNVYLDRQFNTIDIIRVLNKHRVRFIMPVQRWDTVKAYFEKDQSNVCDAIVYKDFIIGNKNRGEKVNLIIVKDKPGPDGEKHPFITNFDVAPCLAYHLYDWYGKRWGIETCYRQLDYDFLARTTTTNYNIRLFYFLFSCCLFNLWVFVNLKLSMIIYGKITKKPIISAKRFAVILYKLQLEYFDDGG